MAPRSRFFPRWNSFAETESAPGGTHSKKTDDLPHTQWRALFETEMWELSPQEWEDVARYKRFIGFHKQALAEHLGYRTSTTGLQEHHDGDSVYDGRDSSERQYGGSEHRGPKLQTHRYGVDAFPKSIRLV